MLKVNKKGHENDGNDFVLVSFLLTYFTPFSSDYIVNFEDVFVCCDAFTLYS